MSIRYTSGSVGRFTFTQANRLSDAADAIESRQFEAPQVERRGAKPIVAVLTSRASGSWFGAGSTAREVWNWSEAGVVLVGGSRRVSAYPGGMKSVEFGEMPNGRAVMLSGTAKPGDIVTIFPLLDDTQEPWYAFEGKVSAQNLMLEIVSSELNEQMSDGNKRVYTYQVEPRKIRYDGGVVIEPWTEMKNGYALNTYEISGAVDAWGHGQELEFEDLGELVPAAIEGYVTATLTDIGTGTDDATYIFEAANPMKPECQDDATPTDAPSGILKRGL
jgi:hypothetical protein